MSVLAGYRVRKQLNPDAGKTGKNLKRFKKQQIFLEGPPKTRGRTQIRAKGAIYDGNFLRTPTLFCRAGVDTITYLRPRKPSCLREY